MTQVPTIGRIVHYVLSEQDVAAIRAWRGVNLDFMGNQVEPGQVYPALIVRAWDDKPDSYVNLQVFLDGNHAYWATSRQVGTAPGTWCWPALRSAPPRAATVDENAESASSSHFHR